MVLKTMQNLLAVLNAMQSVLVDQLRDLCNAERQLLTTLPKIAKSSTTPALRQALERHLSEAEQLVERLDRIFDALGAQPVSDLIGHEVPALGIAISQGETLGPEDIAALLLESLDEQRPDTDCPVAEE